MPRGANGDELTSLAGTSSTPENRYAAPPAELWPLSIDPVGTAFQHHDWVVDNNAYRTAIDRPVGVTRNSGDGPGFVGLDLRWYREFRFAPSRKDKSRSITISVDEFNILNRVNYQNYVGVLTSLFLR